MRCRFSGFYDVEERADTLKVMHALVVYYDLCRIGFGYPSVGVKVRILIESDDRIVIG